MQPRRPRRLNRRGPRPLLLHLMLAMQRSLASTVVSSNSSSDLRPSSKRLPPPPPWFAHLAADADNLSGGDNQPDGLLHNWRPDNWRPAWEESWERSWEPLSKLIAGILAYRRHPFVRDLVDPPSLWAEGGSRVLDHGHGETDATQPAVLFVPSLINRAYILDLAADRSMLRYLAANGQRPLLLDWGWPGEAERRFTLTDYVAGRLERAITAAVAATGGPVVLAGFCMGGMLALAAAQRRPDLVSRLALLATPWDFHAPDAVQAQAPLRHMNVIEPMLEHLGVLPIDAIQTVFALFDPEGVARKYCEFPSLPPDCQRAQMFVALEDWLNDGVPLAASVAREALTGWYGLNTPASLAWQIAGQTVDPASLDLPCLVAIPSRDRLVPPESAHALARALRRSHVIEPGAGHIGMVAGTSAESGLWRPMLAWLNARPT